MMKINKAIFLDRDGVINKEKSYITDLAELEIYPFIMEAMDIFKELNYLTVVVTNQSAVARGMLSEEKLKEINTFLQESLKLDAVYYCPHLPPSDGFEVPPYNIECDCRKPKSGMILKAIDEFNINVEKSFFIGDRATDIILGQNVKLKTILVNSGYGVKRLEYPVSPDYIFENLLSFAKFLLDKN